MWRPKPWEVPLAAAEGISALDPPACSRLHAGLHRRLARRAVRHMTPRKSRQHRDERAQLALTAECAGYLDANPLLFDAVIDVSGFAYGDDWGLAGYRRIAPIVRHCQRAGKQVIFMPQAWGPFKSEGGRAAIGSLLSGQHVRYYSRDKQSSRHLESVLEKSSQAATPYPDIAFLFQGDSADRGTVLLQRAGLQHEATGDRSSSQPQSL